MNKDSCLIRRHSPQTKYVVKLRALFGCHGATGIAVAVVVGTPLTLLHLPHSYSLFTTPPLTHQGCLWPARETELLFLSIGFRGEWNIFSHVFVCLGHSGLMGFIWLSLLRCLPYKLLWRQHASTHNSSTSSSFSSSNKRWIWMFSIMSESD